MPYSGEYQNLPDEQKKDYHDLPVHEQELIDQEYPRVYIKNGVLVEIPEEEYHLAKTIFWEVEDQRLPDEAREAVGWVARNRKEDDSPRWGSTYQDVVTQPGQFSPHITNNEKLTQTLQNPLERASWERAVEAASQVANAPDSANPIPRTVNFYSPVGMDPPGKVPPWAPGMKKVTVEGVDPWQYTFFEPK